MKKIFALTLATVLAMGTLAGCGGSSSSSTESAPADTSADAAVETEAADDYKLVMKLSHVFSPDEQLSKSMELVAERIYEKTNGAIEIQCYGQAQLATYKDGVEQVVNGAQFISVEDPSYLGDYVADFKPFVGPMLYQTYDEYVQMIETDLIQDMIKQAEDYNIKVLGLDYIFGFRNVMTNKVIESPDDLKGMKLRTPGSDLFIDTINAMGATATSLAWSETLSAVSQGVVDGLEGSEFTNLGTKCYEYIENVAETKHFLGTCGVYFPLDIWESIPAEYQTIIAEEFDYGGEEMTQICTESYAETRAELESYGIKFNEVDYDAFGVAIAGVYADMEENDGCTPGIYEALKAELEIIRG
ncbi:C4-dicarboxylate TRAP transporter substrate-binding protein [Chakrabartyella piscis]|uniref:C4-dicarboxylate TRAP transporter substrate-binding protein n=1 Tax=Chakrabartyella piscis TaxID=2918914 RepID=UPI002958C6E7|nr:C4-dicarboxylate TRAP transporter substrate-binding protein [Chakrabartyella piscis]